MPPSSFQAVTPQFVPQSLGQQEPEPLVVQVQARFARLCTHCPSCSLTAVVENSPALRNGPGLAEYVVRATVSLEGRAVVSSLAAASTVEDAEDRARLRCLMLAEAAVGAGDGRTVPSAVPHVKMSSSPAAESPSEPALSAASPVQLFPAAIAVNSGNADITGSADIGDSDINDSNIGDELGNGGRNDEDYGSDDGLGDTVINFAPLSDEIKTPKTSPVAPVKSNKPKPRPKKSAAARPNQPSATKTQSAGPSPQTTVDASAGIIPETAAGTASEIAVSDSAAPPAPEFVADWSEDLAQISVELKRLNWDSQQEQAYLQRTFNKSSRDDIIDHRELMDYLSYLQALPSHFEALAAEDDSPIADTGLSVDEADLKPQSIQELITSAGLKSGSDIAAPPAAVVPPAMTALSPDDAPVATEATAPPATTPDSPEGSLDEAILREPEVEAEVEAEPGETESSTSPSLDPELTHSGLTRGEMMDETARLCKALGWKNRQGSDFLKATYNKATRKDLTDEEMMDFLEQLQALSTAEALPY